MQRLRDNGSSKNPIDREMARLLRLGRAPDPPASVEKRIRAALVPGARHHRRAGAAMWLRWAVAIALVLVTGTVAGAWVIKTRAERRKRDHTTMSIPPGATPSLRRSSRAKAASPEAIAPPAITGPPEAIAPPPSRLAPAGPRLQRPWSLQPPIDPVPAAAATGTVAPERDEDDGPLAPRSSPPPASVDPPTDPPTDPPPEPPVGRPAEASTITPAAPEAALVLEATRALHRDGNPREALRLVGSYLERYPAGALVEESIALSIEARVALGEAAEATALARDYLARFPDGRYRKVANSAIRRFEPR